MHFCMSQIVSHWGVILLYFLCKNIKWAILKNWQKIGKIDIYWLEIFGPSNHLTEQISEIILLKS